MMNLDIEKVEMPSADKLGIADKWILTKLNALVKSVRTQFDAYELGIALSEIYDFVWDIFCDWYIELSKPALSAKGTEANKVTQNVIVYVLESILKLLHPFIPFITEEIYLSLPHFDDCESIMISSYPVVNESLDFGADYDNMEKVIEVIKAIRTRRAEMNVPPSKKAKLFVVTKYEDTFNTTSKILEKLASASEVIVVDKYEADDAVMIATDAGSLYIPLSEVVDFEKEKARLTAEQKKNDAEIERIEKKLSNEGFVSKAPANVIDGERAKLKKYLETREALNTALAKLK
jgi:valyl-tRNA synthetase